MRFVSVRDLRGKSSEIWKSLSDEKDIVITSNGRPIALLSAISESSLEESLATLRRARAMAAVQEIQSVSVLRGANRTPLKEINAEIKTVRRNRGKNS